MFSSRLCCAPWGTDSVYLFCYESYGAVFAKALDFGTAYLALRFPLAVCRIHVVLGLGLTMVAFSVAQPPSSIHHRYQTSRQDAEREQGRNFPNCRPPI
jgi:hypothetical protein